MFRAKDKIMIAEISKKSIIHCKISYIILHQNAYIVLCSVAYYAIKMNAFFERKLKICSFYVKNIFAWGISFGPKGSVITYALHR